MAVKPLTKPAVPHYQGGIEPIDFIVSHGFDYCEGNIVKYITRWRKKDGLKDLYKARNYLNWLIEGEFMPETRKFSRFGTEVDRLLLEAGVSRSEFAKRLGWPAGRLLPYLRSNRPQNKTIVVVARALGKEPVYFYPFLEETTAPRS